MVTSIVIIIGTGFELFTNRRASLSPPIMLDQHSTLLSILVDQASVIPVVLPVAYSVVGVAALITSALKRTEIDSIGAA